MSYTETNRNFSFTGGETTQVFEALPEVEQAVALALRERLIALFAPTVSEETLMLVWAHRTKPFHSKPFAVDYYLVHNGDPVNMDEQAYDLPDKRKLIDAGQDTQLIYDMELQQEGAHNERQIVADLQAAFDEEHNAVGKLDIVLPNSIADGGYPAVHVSRSLHPAPVPLIGRFVDLGEFDHVVGWPN